VNDAAARLGALLEAARPGTLAPWLTDATVDGAATFDRGAFEIAFAGARRRFGTETLQSAAAIADTDGRTWSIAGWGLDEAARAVLVLRAVVAQRPDDRTPWLDGIYRAGALRERTAVLRALALLPDPGAYLSIALDACRASTQPIFEAIACENPYPAAHFSEASFNQMALKAVFTGVALARILDLDIRRTSELARMAADYAAERRAAGRPVPPDLTLLGTA
jgi:hypothetical protein